MASQGLRSTSALRPQGQMSVQVSEALLSSLPSVRLPAPAGDALSSAECLGPHLQPPSVLDLELTGQRAGPLSQEKPVTPTAQRPCTPSQCVGAVCVLRVGAFTSNQASIYFQRRASVL